MKPPTLDPRDVLPTIHCAPEICRSCREWIVLQFDLREKAGREAQAEETVLAFTACGAHEAAKAAQVIVGRLRKEAERDA